MITVLTVREPRTGFPVNYAGWPDFRRRRAEARRLTLRQRVQLCNWCWGFGAVEFFTVPPSGSAGVGVACLGCGRVGPDLIERSRTPR